MAFSKSKKFFVTLAGIVGIVGLILTYPYLRFEFRKRNKTKCFVESLYPKREFSTWNGDDTLQVYFSAQGGDNCVCPEYPVIGVFSKHPTRWIQVVEVNIPTPTTQLDLGGDLNNKPLPWIFADTSPAHRQLGFPFYDQDNVPQPFWDHPCWNYGSDLFKWISFTKHQPIIWIARLYAVKVSDNVIHAEMGLRWGWNEDSRYMIHAIEPIQILPAQWNQDSLLLEKVYKQWKFQKPSLKP